MCTIFRLNHSMQLWAILFKLANDQNCCSSNIRKTFKLKHSDRFIRSLRNCSYLKEKDITTIWPLKVIIQAPSLNDRDWKLDPNDFVDSVDNDFNPNNDLQHLTAELLFICRPMLHRKCFQSRLIVYLLGFKNIFRSMFKWCYCTRSGQNHGYSS